MEKNNRNQEGVGEEVQTGGNQKGPGSPSKRESYKQKARLGENNKKHIEIEKVDPDMRVEGCRRWPHFEKTREGLEARVARI